MQRLPVFRVTASTIRLREKPSLDSQVVGELPRGTLVSPGKAEGNMTTIDGKRGSWVEWGPDWYLFSGHLEDVSETYAGFSDLAANRAGLSPCRVSARKTYSCSTNPDPRGPRSELKPKKLNGVVATIFVQGECLDYRSGLVRYKLTLQKGCCPPLKYHDVRNTIRHELIVNKGTGTVEQLFVEDGIWECH